MLPGFRFLFAAVILSLSILVFGLGAAALLRAAHEEFASMPRRSPPETIFARQEPAPVTLALLRFEPPPVEKGPEDKIADTIPALAAETADLSKAELAKDAAPVEPEQLAALKPEAPMAAETAKPELPAADIATATSPATGAPVVASDDVKVAAIAATPEPVPAGSPLAPIAPALSLEGKLAATRIATLGGPEVIIDEKISTKAAEAKPDRSAVRKRSAQRAKERRRTAARRARLAQQAAAAAAQQAQANPFGQTAVARGSR